MISYAVGFGNIWRFPFLLYSNGGGAFLIPYFLALIFISIPMYIIETAYGQLFRFKINSFFTEISPRFWGLSYAQFIVNVTMNIYYMILMAWSMAYLFYSFRTPLPW